MCSKTLPVVLLLVVLLTKFSRCQNLNNTVLEKFNWDCANNASCVRSVAKNIIKSYHRRESIDFGLFSIEPVPHRPRYAIGRSSRIWDFFNGNAVRVPFGPMVLSVQRSEDSDYLEVALLKNVPSEGRGPGGKKGKKQMQVFIPMFLAANAIGWMMLAIKAVGVLTIKAFLVSKLALIVAASVIVKKLMENATEKMFLAHYPEHSHHHGGYAMPYNMEYALPAHTLQGHEYGGNEVYSLQVAHPHPLEHLTAAESSLSHAVELQNGTHPHILAAVAGLGPKVKRDDSVPQWSDSKMKPKRYKYLSSNNPPYFHKKT